MMGSDEGKRKSRLMPDFGFKQKWVHDDVIF